MAYTRQEFGRELKDRVRRREHLAVIGEWALAIYLDYDVDRNFREMLLVLNRMGDDPQFEYSYEELDKIADDLIAGKEVKL